MIQMFNRTEKKVEVGVLPLPSKLDMLKGYCFGVLSMLVFCFGIYMYANRGALRSVAQLYLYNRDILTNEKIMKNLVTNKFLIENMKVDVKIEKK